MVLGCTCERFNCFHGALLAKSRITDATFERRSNCRDTVTTISQTQQAAAVGHSFFQNCVNTVDKIELGRFSAAPDAAWGGVSGVG